MRAVRIMLIILLLKVTVVTLYVLFEKNVCDWLLMILLTKINY